MTLQNKQILAKSNPKISLKRHIDDGLIILEYLKKCIPNVPNIQGESNFWNILKVCVICHDLGKSHKEFQKMLIGENNEWFCQRHELFSLPRSLLFFHLWYMEYLVFVISLQVHVEVNNLI